MLSPLFNKTHWTGYFHYFVSGRVFLRPKLHSWINSSEGRLHAWHRNLQRGSSAACTTAQLGGQPSARLAEEESAPGRWAQRFFLRRESTRACVSAVHRWLRNPLRGWLHRLVASPSPSFSLPCVVLWEDTAFDFIRLLKLVLCHSVQAFLLSSLLSC